MNMNYVDEYQVTTIMKGKNRGFEVVSMSFMKPMSSLFGEPKIPTRSDKGSAGYDFYSCEDKLIGAGETHLFWTNVKAYMNIDEVLEIYPRSSMGAKGIVLSNTVGIIDSTYFENKKNDGNIGIMLKNTSDSPVFIGAGDRIAQGMFKKYLVADEDVVVGSERKGGFGSSGK